MSQQNLVIKAIEAGNKTIQAIHEHTAILRPNIRRILGQGAQKGVFKRLGKGVYTLSMPDGEGRGYIHTGAAENVLPRLAAEGVKFDTVFLDVAYYSKALIGGNRGIKQYDFLTPDPFVTMMQAVSQMLRTDDSHVYLMLSGAKTAQKDMQHYLFGALECGLQYVKEGKYQKLFQSGKPVTNVRGAEASAERLILLSKSGRVRAGESSDIILDYQVERPSVKKSYSTEKSPVMLEQLILQSTYENEVCGDPSAGSGIFGKVALLRNRIVHLVEIMEDAVEKFIVPKFLEFC